MVRGTTLTIAYLGVVAVLCAPALAQPSTRSPSERKVRVACVGDSITYGYGIADPAGQSYPALLQKMLGDRYEVRNFGYNGATLLKNGHKPYWKKPPYPTSLEFKPDFVIINLGANDAIDQNWKTHGSEFTDDYKWLIGKYRALSSQPKVLICEILPIFSSHGRYRECRANRDQMEPMIRAVAKSEKTSIIDLYAPFIKRRELFPDGLHPNEHGALIMAQQIYASLTGKQPPQVSAVQESHETPEATSFEAATPGRFETLDSSIGEWTATAGRVLVDNKHASTGRQCLQLAGPDSSVELEVAKGLKTDGYLTFRAERWTRRSPFAFRIEGHSGGKWSEIYNGDKQIKVGRPFLSSVEVPLGKADIAKLRFSVSSPPNTGVLIDDVRIAPAQPQKITSVEVIPFALPALVGNANCAMLKLKIETTGRKNPISLTDLTASLSASTDFNDLASVQVVFGGADGSFSTKTLFGSTSAPARRVNFSGNQKLADGKNYVWVACTLKGSANIDHRLGAACESVTFSNGKTFDLQSTFSIQSLGVAVRDRGDDGVHTYRIPGLATTKRGTLIAVYDVRRRSGGDLPGDIDVGMSRSTDGGRTWEPMKIIMDMGDDPNFRYDGIGDPTVLVDKTTGTIWCGATWSHGNRSWVGSQPGLDPADTGQFILVKSDDDGLTWSRPINITKQVKKPEWSFLLQGPGKGITMSDGTLVMPAQYQDPPNASDKRANRLPHSTFIYSRDRGATWKTANGAWDDTTESQVVELDDGRIMLNCRNNRLSRRAIMTTSDMGKTWREHSSHNEALIEPGACMASLINVGRELRQLGVNSEYAARNDFLLFSNPDSLRGRNHITIKASLDGGDSWPHEHHLLLDEESGSGYSCMTMIDAETVGIIYEGSQAHMTFQRVKLADILSPPKTQKTKNPKTAKARNADRPNILFIVSEDNSEHLGCYGEKRVHTPHLDALAAGGVRYTRAYVPYSVCSPSRAAFLTGLYTRQTGHIGLATHRFSMYRDFKTMPAYFQQAGYFTGFLGKTHVNPERLVEEFIDHRAIKSSNFGKTTSIKTYADEARAVMQKAADEEKPFLLIVNYADAHRKFVGKSKNGFPTTMVNDPIAPFPWIGSDTPHLREELRDYFNCMNRLDEGVGMVLKSLDEMNIRDNTLLIYISDHGADFPRGKGSIYENGTRIPMIVNYPKGFSKGKVESGMVSTIDILPTVLRTAGLPIPQKLPGLALQDIDSKKSPPRKYIHTFTTGSSPNLLYVQFGIRDDRYKLVYNPDRALNRLAESRYRNSQLPKDQHVQSFLHPPEYELFDLQEDPHEWKNLANDEKHQPIREQLLKAMQSFQREIKDPFAGKENVETFIAEQKEYQHKPYKTPGFRWPHLDMFKRAQEAPDDAPSQQKD